MVGTTLEYFDFAVYNSLAAKQLVQQANDNGGRDNISVILVRVLDEFGAPTGWFAKFKTWFK